MEFRRGNRQKHVIVKDRQIGDGIVEFGTKMISYADEVVAFGFIAGCDLFRRNLTVRIRAVAVKRTTKPLAASLKGSSIVICAGLKFAAKSKFQQKFIEAGDQVLSASGHQRGFPWFSQSVGADKSE